MIKLIKLEWEKNNITKYIRNAAIMTGILLLLFLPLVREVKATNIIESYHNSLINICIELLSNMSYMIFTSVMLASFIISSYKNKTIYIMLSYPIKRRKLIVAQILSVWTFNIICLIITKLLSYAMISLISHALHINSSFIYWNKTSFYLQIMISSIIMISICFVTLLIGIITKSVKATIISSVILVCFTQGNIGQYTLMGNIKFYFALLVLSILSVCLTIYEFERKDI